jgi:hypothetical protein
MTTLETRIKTFAKEQGIDVIGLAGPERLDGPPSLNPAYTMRGARSVVAFAMPMAVDAIYAWLGKKSHVPHALDQTVMNAEMRWKAEAVADFIRAQGYRARAVPTNNSYRRSLDVFATRPSFSHRFGAIAAGIAGQGWSGNVMTREYGAAVYLGSVVTNAKLQSDPALPPRYFIENFCYHCRVCEKTCVAGMFDAQEEEYVLLNGSLHPRGKRHNIDFCNASCFGLHSISRDKKWSTWGVHWMRDWIDGKPNPGEKKRIRRQMLIKGSRTGDATPRYDLIRRLGAIKIDPSLIREYRETYPYLKTQAERNVFIQRWSEKLGVKNLKDDRILTCGNCALVCGPTLEETRKRYDLLINAGIVIPGPEAENVVVDGFTEAAALRGDYMPKVSKEDMLRDAKNSGILWSRLYLGFEPLSTLKGWLYARKLKKATRQMAGKTRIGVGKTATPQ